MKLLMTETDNIQINKYKIQFGMKINSTGKVISGKGLDTEYRWGLFLIRWLGRPH